VPERVADDEKDDEHGGEALTVGRAAGGGESRVYPTALAVRRHGMDLAPRG
jgi:hypothetical protein